MMRPRVTVARLMTIVVFVALVFAAWSNNADKNDEIAGLAACIKQMETDADRNQTTVATIRDLRERLDRVHGHVTQVNHERREVLIDIGQTHGARARMRMWVYSSASPAVPYAEPKGKIQLTQVGEPFSTARIIRTDNGAEPIGVGDHVLSPFWSPKNRVRFALIGKIEINRDGKDDRDELKGWIQEAGGVIDFDLPPPDVGNQTGTLAPAIDWYLVDHFHYHHSALLRGDDVTKPPAPPR